MPEGTQAKPGHNQPPPDADPLLERLQKDHADLLARRDALLSGIGRAPTEIVDEETAGKMADFVDLQLSAFIKQVDTVHDTEKAPYLAGTRTVDGFWHTLKDQVEAGIKTLNQRRKKYADDKAAAERKRREAEADRLRQEAAAAQRAAEQAAETVTTETDLSSAIDAEAAAQTATVAAEKATQAAAAKPAELGRTRGAYGGRTTLRTEWTFADLDRAKIDLEALRPYLPEDALQKAVRAWIAANKGALKAKTITGIAGVRIFQDTRL